MAYTCTTCGAIAESPGHLCSPCDNSQPCNLCGKPEDGARHLCRDQVPSMQFTCSSCGRVAEREGLLCNPVPIQS